MSGAVRPAPPLAVLLVLAGVVTAVVLAVHNQDGMLLGNDSAFYTSVADNLRGGDGLTTPVGFEYHGMSPQQFVAGGPTLPLQGAPPLFPVLLAMGGAVGLGATTTTAVVNALAGVALGVLTAALTWFLSRRSLVAVALVLGFTLAQPTLLVLFRAVLPEGLFAALLLGQVLLVWHYLRTRDLSVLVWLGLLTATAVLVRQIGFALVASGGLAVLALRPGPLADRARHAGLFGAVALVPVFVYWPLSSRGAADEGGGFTQLVAHLPGGDDYRALRDTLEHWLADPAGPGALTPIAGLLAAAAVVLAVLGWRTAGARRDDDERAARLLASVVLLTVACYLGVLWLTVAFLDADVSFTARYLAVLQPLLFGLVAGGLVRFVGRMPASTRPEWSAAIGVVALLVLGARAWGAVDHGVGIPLVDATTTVGPFVEQLPADAVVFAEVPELLYNGVGRAAYPLPGTESRYTLRANPDVGLEVAEIGELAAERPVYVVVTRAGIRPHMVGVDDLSAQLTLTEVASGPGEVVYRVDP